MRQRMERILLQQACGVWRESCTTFPLRMRVTSSLNQKTFQFRLETWWLCNTQGVAAGWPSYLPMRSLYAILRLTQRLVLSGGMDE